MFLLRRLWRIVRPSRHDLLGCTGRRDQWLQHARRGNVYTVKTCTPCPSPFLSAQVPLITHGLVLVVLLWSCKLGVKAGTDLESHPRLGLRTKSRSTKVRSYVNPHGA